MAFPSGSGKLLSNERNHALPDFPLVSCFHSPLSSFPRLGLPGDSDG